MRRPNDLHEIPKPPVSNLVPTTLPQSWNPHNLPVVGPGGDLASRFFQGDRQCFARPNAESTRPAVIASGERTLLALGRDETPVPEKFSVPCLRWAAVDSAIASPDDVRLDSSPLALIDGLRMRLSFSRSGLAAGSMKTGTTPSSARTRRRIDFSQFPVQRMPQHQEIETQTGSEAVLSRGWRSASFLGHADDPLRSFQ